MKLLTITPNPAIDRTLAVPELSIGSVQRASSVHLGAGGKGLNVCRAGRLLGVEGVATGPLAGATGRQIRELAADEGVHADWFSLEKGENRNCLLINHSGPDTTVIDEPGPELATTEWEGFMDHCTHLGKEAECIAVCGSLPPGLPSGSMAALVKRLAVGNRPLVVDTSRSALSEVLRLPVVVKVNWHELKTALGLSNQAFSVGSSMRDIQSFLSDPAEVGNGPSAIILTRGREPAFWIEATRAWTANTPLIDRMVSSVGSGDAFLAGVCASLLRARPAPECLCWGVAAGSANAESELPGRFSVTRFRELLQQVDWSEVSE